MKKGFIYRHCLLLAIAWFWLIFILCATPGQYIPSAGWMALLSIDKLVHAGIFFVLSALSILVASRYQPHFIYAALVYICFCLLYGAALEYMQANYFSNRSADWLDIVANSTGCLAAFILRKKIIRRFMPVTLV